MASLSQLLALPGLGLELIQSGPHDPDITWVSVTELLDLSGYLEGGEVIMTTGLSLEPHDPKWLDFVAALSRARIAAIGFGVGVSHERVPAPLVQAASTYRVALFKIPLPTPFVAVSKAVAELLRLDELRAAHTALQAQKRILDGARGEQEPAEVLASIAQATGRQLALFSGPSDELDAGTTIASTAGFALEGAEFISLDADSTLRLAIASGDPLTPEGSSVIAAGSMVLGLGVRGGRAADRVERERWEHLTARLLDGALPLSAVQILAPRTQVPKTVRVLAVQGTPDELAAWRVEALQAADRLISASTELPGGLARAWQIVDGAHPDAAVSRVKKHGLDLAIGRQAPSGSVHLSLRSARARLQDLPETAAPYAQPRTPQVIWADRDAPFLEAVLGLTTDEGSGSMSLAVLGPLSDRAAAHPFPAEDTPGAELSNADRLLLRDTLRALFNADGQRGPAASALGIHRNTLRDRVSRIERLTGRSLSSAEDRAELWFALRSEELT